MRDLKFRVWDKKLKVMSFPFYNTDINEDGFFVSDDAVWMQYTGFEDKNYTEIFEGDIVEVNSSDVLLVIFDKGAWRLANDEKSLTIWTAQDRIEVIGNKFEHPDLVRLPYARYPKK